MLPKLRITAVLIDVDGTMTMAPQTTAESTNEPTDPVTVLVNLLAETEGLASNEALTRIRQAGNPAVTCVFDLLPALGVDRQMYWDRLVTSLRTNIAIAPDAAALIQGLRRKRIRLYSATTNSRMMTLAKLSLGGLATSEGSPYFAGFFGGDRFGDPQGKFSRDFFPSILREARLEGRTTLMVGDDFQRDLLPAQEAGITQVVLVRRAQPVPVTSGPGGGIYVRSLESILEMI